MLDLDQLNKLSDDQKAAYMRHERTFESDGWKDVEEWARFMADAQLGRMMNATSWEAFQLAKGSRMAFLSMVSLRENTEEEFAQLAKNNEDEKIAEEELLHE